MKKLLFLVAVLLPALLFSAPYDIKITQRKPDDSGFIEKTISPQAESVLTFDATKLMTTTLLADLGGGGGGTGTVTEFTAGNLTPLFTTGVATSTTTPALTFILTDAAPNSFFAGPATGATGPPVFRIITLADIPDLSGIYLTPGAADGVYVPQSRFVATALPLTGGGDLSADRTIGIVDAGADGTTKGAAAFTAADFNAAAGVVSIDYANGQAATGSTKGFLTPIDWTAFASKEPALGNPAANGYILSSTTGGVRSWIPAPSGGGGGVTIHNDLTGIQGGATNDYYHLTSAQHANLTSATSTTLASLNGTPIGNLTPSSGAFTYGLFTDTALPLSSPNSLVADFSGIARLSATGPDTSTFGQLNLYVATSDVGAATLVGSFTSTGLNSTPIGVTNAAAARFSAVGIGTAGFPAATLEVNGDIKANSIGATTPGTGVFTNLTAFSSFTLNGDILQPADWRVGFNAANSFQFLGSSILGTIGGNNVFGITSTGINGTAIGMGTPSTGAFTTISVPRISNLTTNGFVKTIGGDGTLTIDTSSYLTTGSASSTYQPLNTNLTAISALITTPYGRDFLTLADAAAARGYIGAGTGNGNGTVTSVGMTVPTFLSVAGSPVTTSGSLDVTLATQTANTVFAGPATGTAAPTFRPLAVADIPSLAGLYDPAGAAATAEANAKAYTDSEIVDLATVYQPLDGDLSAISALTGTDTIYYRNGASTWAPVAIGANLTFSGGTLAATGGGAGAIPSITGTAEQVLVNGTTGSPQTGAVTLTLPQSIATTSDVQFNGLTTTGAVLFNENALGPAGFATVVLRGDTTNRTRIQLDAAGGSDPVFQGRRAGGTLAAPTATSDGALLAGFAASGYKDTAYSANAAVAFFRANGVFTDTSTPTRFDIELTAPGTTSRLLAARFTHTGLNSTAIGTDTPGTGRFTNASIASSGNSIFNIERTDTTGIARLMYRTAGADVWSIGVRTGQTDLNFFEESSGTPIMLLTTTGINATRIGFTTPSSGNFADLQSSNILFLGNQINEYKTNGPTSLAINYSGYAGGTTQFRSFDIYNGKNNFIATFDGPSGNVGIGTATPTQKLDVAGASRASELQATNSLGLRLYNDAAYIGFFNTANDTRSGYLQGASNGVFTLQAEIGAKNILLNPSGGNVGIGTNAPAQKLHVNGTARIGTSLYSDGGINLGQDGTGNRYAIIDFIGDDTYSDYGLRILRDNIGPNSTSILEHQGTGPFRFKANDAASITFETSNAERMRVDPTGNVGIGTTTPWAKFHVDGPHGDPSLSSSANATAAFHSSTSVQLLMGGYSASPYGFWLQTNNNNAGSAYPIVMNPLGGGVAIGTSNPTAQFHTTGSVRFQGFGAGTLVTDASGNVSVGSGGGGGPINGTTIGLTTPAAGRFTNLESTYLAVYTDTSYDPNSVVLSANGSYMVAGGYDGIIVTEGGITNGSSSGTIQFGYAPTYPEECFTFNANGGQFRMMGGALNGSTAGADFNSPYIHIYNSGSGYSRAVGILGDGPDVFAAYISASGINNTRIGVGEQQDGYFTNLSMTQGMVSTRAGVGLDTHVTFQNANGIVGRVITAGTGASYITSSDRRLKTNIRDFRASGKIIDGLQPRVFDWKTGEKDAVGFIAQELNEVFPAAVFLGDNNKVEIEQPWGVDNAKLIPVLVAEIQALRARLDVLEKERSTGVLPASVPVKVLKRIRERR